MLFMKRLSIPFIGCVLFFMACNNSHSPYEKAYSADSASVAGFSSIAAVNEDNDSVHQFIRTANIKFKTADVIKASDEIESLVGMHAGYITYTQLNSEENNTTRTQVNEDSTMLTTLYTVRNTMTIRVPNTQLDSFLKALSKEVDFLDYRTIKADDISGLLLSNSMEQKRLQAHRHRLMAAIDNRGRKLNEIQNAEYNLLDTQLDADDATLSTHSLADQVHFSTIQLEIYQNQSIKKEMVANAKYPEPYKEGFGKKVINSLTTGFEYVTDLVVFILRFWWLILIALLGYYGYRKFRLNKNK